MNKKKFINQLQNLALVLLAASALYLLSLTPGISLTDQFQAFLTARPQSDGQYQAADLESFIPPLHMMVTSDLEYGRSGLFNISPQDTQVQLLMPLLGEALGSASGNGFVTDRAMQEAMDSQGFFLDLTTELPLSVIAAWLEMEPPFDQPVRRIALTTEDSSNASLYLQSGNGTTLRCKTALSVSAVRDLANSFSPNGAIFAYESNYSTLSPYTLLISETPSLPQITSSIPAGFSADTLLSVLDFNVHNKSRYRESGGTEVILESPRELRVSPGGTASYTGDATVASPLYHVSSSSLPLAEALHAASVLATVLTEGTGAAPLVLRAAEATEDGYQFFFRYQYNGYPVYFTSADNTLEDGDALSVTISGSAIVAFTYLCRSYAGTDSTSLLLPPAQATAVASIYPGAELFIGYTDHGQEIISASWQAG